MKGIQDIRLTENNVKDIICCPGGLEVKEKKFKGDITKTLSWRHDMIEKGMTGFVSYVGDFPRGFVEYMPAEKSPFPIERPGAVVLMCYHWASRDDHEDEHLSQEKRLLDLVIEDVEDIYTGIATLGWDNQVHYPIEFLRDLGFQEVEKNDITSLMWLPFSNNTDEPVMAKNRYEITDLSLEGKLSIEAAYSSRCPYSIHNAARLKEVVKEIDDKRIELSVYHIDTHEESIKYYVSPWNWEWLYLNGEEATYFQTTSQELKRTILEKLDSLEDK